MRTKTLLLAAAALSAGVLASSAQVYSANVVGYVNTYFGPGGNVAQNPLKNSTNDLNTIIPVAVDGSILSRWNNALATFEETPANFYEGIGWDPNPTLLPGQGFYLYVPGAQGFTNTFVGDVMQGADLQVAIPNGGSLVGSVPPIGGSITNVLAQLVLDADAGATASKWDYAKQNWQEVPSNYYGDLVPGGWDPADASYNIAVGEAVYIINNGPATVWHRSFTVQ